MKKSIYLGLIVLVLSTLSGCDSYNYYTAGLNKTNLSHYHSFAWMPVINNSGKKMMPANGEADAKIKDATTSALTSKGLSLQQRQPDLLVSYTTSVGTGTSTTYYSTWGGWGAGFGWGWGGYGWGGFYRPYYAFGGPFPYAGQLTYADQEHFKEGTLVIDLIDRRTQRIVWRGFGVGEVHHDPKKNVDDIPKVVQGILDQLNLAAPATAIRAHGNMSS